MQRQMGHSLPCNGLGIIKRLLLGNPQRGLRYGYGEIIDLDAIELVNADLDQTVLATQFQLPLVVQHLAECAVLQLT